MAYSGGSALQAEESGEVGGWLAAVIIKKHCHPDPELVEGEGPIHLNFSMHEVLTLRSG